MHNLLHLFKIAYVVNHRQMWYMRNVDQPTHYILCSRYMGKKPTIALFREWWPKRFNRIFSMCVCCSPYESILN